MIFSSTPPIPSRRNSSSTFLCHHIKVDFMGNVNYFLGTYFNWITHKDGNISVHLSQSAFIEFAPHCFSFHTLNKVPNMTPYCSGLPIASIPPVYPLDPDLPFIKQVYQINHRSVCRIAKWRIPNSIVGFENIIKVQQAHISQLTW